MKTIIIFLLFSAVSLECIAQLDMIVQKSILALSLDGSRVSSDSRIDLEKKLIQFDRTGGYPMEYVTRKLKSSKRN